MKVAILNFEDVVASSVVGPYDILSRLKNVNRMFGIEDSDVNFEVEIVTPENYASVPEIPGAIKRTIDEPVNYDLVIIPAMFADRIEKVLTREQKLIEWIKKQYKKGSEVASICLGAFLLAETGLLNGKRATTHWISAPLFKKLYPMVQLEDDKIIIDEGRIYSSGGAFSFSSFMIYLIEKFCGRETALAASKMFMIQVHETVQSTFTIFELQKSHEDIDIKPVQDYIEKHYGDKLYIESLANKFNMTNRTFIRRFTSATGNTPLEYIQRVRVEAAKRLLERGRTGVEQACIKSGYEDFNFFRKLFKRYTGLSPQEYRRKYGTMFNKAIIS